MPHSEAFSASLMPSEGATDPSPSCNELPGGLLRSVVRAALPVSETADGHGWPPSHWQTPRAMQSLTVAVSGHLIRSTPHHAVIVMQQRVFFLPMCSTQYSGSRLSNRADSGAPTYSSKRGSCSCTPYS